MDGEVWYFSTQLQPLGIGLSHHFRLLLAYGLIHV